MNGADDNLHIIPHLDRVSRIALAIGGAGVIISILLASMRPDYFWPSYLGAMLFWLSISLGCTALLLLYNVTGGRWGDVTRPILETSARGIVLLFLLFIPIFFVMRHIYPWDLKSVQDASDPAKFQFEHWLNPALAYGFITRAVIYWVLWTFMAWALNHRPAPRPGLLASIPHGGHGDRGVDVPTIDHNPAGAESPSGSGSWLKNFSGPFIVVYAVTISLAAIDWSMSLQPGWTSTIYGLLFIASQGLSAFAFCTVVLMILTRWIGRGRDAAGALVGKQTGSTISAGDPAHAHQVMPADFNDLGNLMLTFTILWAYMSFSQFLIQWSGSLPAETQYYRDRVHDGWGIIGLLLILFHFFLPFFCLLSRDIKRRAVRLGMLAVAVLVMRQVDVYWFVLPSVHRGESLWQTLGLGDLVAPLTIGGLWVAFFCWQMGRRARQGVSFLPPPVPGHHHGEPEPGVDPGAAAMIHPNVQTEGGI